MISRVALIGKVDLTGEVVKVSLTSKVDLIKELGRVDLISKEDLDTYVVLVTTLDLIGTGGSGHQSGTCC